MNRQKMKAPALAGARKINGCLYLENFLDLETQAGVMACIEAGLCAAPFFQPCMPRTGRPFSVQMTNFGRYGWVADRAGYRYQETHPETGRPWPALPPLLEECWQALLPGAPAPEACLVNLYHPGAKMGLHQDRDEADLSCPVLSISLGDTARFRIGGTVRGAPTTSFRLASGDVVILTGPSRLAFHGIDRIWPGTSRLCPAGPLLAGGGRINLTLRRVGR